MHKLKKYLLILFLPILMSLTFAPVIHAETTKAEAEKSEDKTYETPSKSSQYLPQSDGKLIVAYEGLFTKKYIPENTCSDEQIQAQDGQQSIQKGNVNGEPTEGKIAKIFTDIISGIVKSVVDVLFGMKCPGVSNGEFSLISEILNISAPLNLTQNYIIMKLVSIVQSIAYVFAFALIVFYGVMYATGYENLEPIKFGIRMFFAMLFVYALPYLMQDILNINNVIVYFFSQINVTFDGGGMTSVVFAGAIKNFFTTITTSFLTNLLTLIIAIVMIYLALTPIIRIMIWWYTRLLKIFFYAIIGPIMVIMMALPQTSKLASKWAKDFIGETFSQVFMMIGMAMLAFIVGNIGDFSHLTNIGWLGTLLVIYASILFLAEVPSIANSFLGSIGGLSEKNLTREAMNASKTTSRMAKNMASGMKEGAKRTSAAATNGERFSLMKSMKQGNGLTGALGGLAGGLAGKGYTAKAPMAKGSLKDHVDSKVKPKIENFQESRNNVAMDKAMKRQERGNAIMQEQQNKERKANKEKLIQSLTKEHGGLVDASQVTGQSLNEQTADLQMDTERRKHLVDQLKNEGSVKDYKNLTELQTNNQAMFEPYLDRGAAQKRTSPSDGGPKGPKGPDGPGSGATPTKNQQATNGGGKSSQSGSSPITGPEMPNFKQNASTAEKPEATLLDTIQAEKDKNSVTIHSPKNSGQMESKGETGQVIDFTTAKNNSAGNKNVEQLKSKYDKGSGGTVQTPDGKSKQIPTEVVRPTKPSSGEGKVVDINQTNKEKGKNDSGKPIGNAAPSPATLPNTTTGEGRSNNPKIISPQTPESGSDAEFFGGNIYKDRPMSDGEFTKYDDEMSMSESDYLSSDQVRENSLERTQKHEEHKAAFYGSKGAGASEKVFDKETGKLDLDRYHSAMSEGNTEQIKEVHRAMKDSDVTVSFHSGEGSNPNEKTLRHLVENKKFEQLEQMTETVKETSNDKVENQQTTNASNDQRKVDRKQKRDYERGRENESKRGKGEEKSSKLTQKNPEHPKD